MCIIKWFRLYNEIIDDPKAAKMTPKEFRFFIYLLCLASECEENGVIPFSQKDISWRLRTPEKETNLYLNKLKELNIITENPLISFINWDKRQYKSDSSKERVRRYREKECNVTVTPVVTPPEQSRTETEQKENKKRLFNEKEFEVFYLAYPNHKGKKEALEKWKKLIKNNELPELSIVLLAIEKQKLWRQNANGEFRPEWKNPATWLNKGCWEDETNIENQKESEPNNYQPSIEDILS